MHRIYFLLAYLVKYLSSEEVACLARGAKQGATNMHAHVQGEQQRKHMTRQSVKSSHARLISLDEITFWVPHHTTVFCTNIANRVNIGSRASRSVVLCLSWSPVSRASPNFGPQPFLDRNTYGPHVQRPEFRALYDIPVRLVRRPKVKISIYSANLVAGNGPHITHGQLHVHPSKVMLYCLRLPEMVEKTLQ